MSWLQHRVYTIISTRFVSKLTYFRPRVSTNLGKMSFKFSAPKIWETVPLGLKCLPHHKFKKEWKSYLLVNWSLILALLICSITDIIWDFISSLAATDYLNLTVSNKKAPNRYFAENGRWVPLSSCFDLATLDTVLKNLVSFSLLTYTCVNALYSVK